MTAPPRVRTVVLNYDARRYRADKLVTELLGLPGVADVMVADGTSTAYIKVDQARFEPDSLAVFQVVEAH